MSCNYIPHEKDETEIHLIMAPSHVVVGMVVEVVVEMWKSFRLVAATFSPLELTLLDFVLI